MSKSYLSKYKDGGAISSGGILYQDLISLFYLFKHIEETRFKEITFETHDDFTMIMDDQEIYVQVKNTQLSISSIRKIINTKLENTKNDAVAHWVVASSYDKKTKNLLRKQKYIKNAIKTSRSDREKLSIQTELNILIEKNKLVPEVFNKVVFDEVSDSQIIDAVKFQIYQWCAINSWEVDLDDFFDKLIAKISTNLRPNRGFLNRREIEELVLNCPKKSYYIKRDASLHNIYFNNSKDSLLIGITKDIYEESHFSDKLNILKNCIELKDWINAEKVANKIKRYKETFMYYYLWVLYHSDNEKLLSEQCQQLIHERQCVYYSNYYQGLLYFKTNRYYKAINNMKYALSEDSTFEVNLRLAELYKLTNKTEKSLEHYRTCMASQPCNPEVLIGISPLLPKHEAIEFLDRAIGIDPNRYNAYFEKGKILRFYGLDKDAYDYFLKYYSFIKDISGKKVPSELLREISFCLISLGDIRAIDYLNRWLDDFLFENFDNKVRDGGSIIIMDGSLNNIEIVVCTKAEDDFVIDTSLLKYTLIKAERSKIFISCTPESFLRMTKEHFQNFKSDLIFEDGYEYLPSIIKIYWSKGEFDKVINSIRLEDNMCLNKDYQFRNKGGDLSFFKEFISKNGSTKVFIEELQNALNLRVAVGSHIIMGWFNNGGEGYFKFCSRVEKSSEAVLVLECAETHEIVHIKFSVDNIEITKKSSFRDSYIKDIELPY
ncbi:dsDNA nuclease domain-containing protein [Paenibacillus xylanexedens]|uniref:dsDNA nuclease domain-containing protein n=1 Tax=Paenibacillus xylanexedens TaxID=528191 RepID=UPI003CFDFF7E